MKFELLTLAGKKYDGDIAEVTLRTAVGALGVLPGHEPLTAVVIPGPVVARGVDGSTEIFATYGGLLEVTPERVRLLADEADHADELVGHEIEEALAHARALRAEAKDSHELAAAEALVDRAAVRLDVVHMRRSHRPQRPTPESAE